MEPDFKKIISSYEYLEVLEDCEESNNYSRYSKLYRFNGELIACTSEFGE